MANVNSSPVASAVTLDRMPASRVLTDRASRRFHTAAFTGLMLLAVALGLWRLEIFPAPWFDEGWWLQIPKNLVLYGQYATRSSEGFRYHDTVLSASPLFYLPVAAAFGAWGIGLLQARLVVVAFFLASCVLTYLIGRKLFGPFAALFALAMFIFVVPADQFTSPLLLGRQVMGEVPALFFLLAGMLTWLHAIDRGSLPLVIVAGVLCGLSVGVKNQFGLVVLPMWIALAAIDLAYYRQHRLRYFAIPLLAAGVVVALHQVFLIAIMGASTYARFLSDLRDASGPQVRVFLSPSAMLNAAKLFASSEYSLLFFPALIYAIVLLFRRDPTNIKPGLPIIFVTGWLLWFVLASVGWARYAFPAFAISFILAGHFLADLGGFGAGMLAQVRRAWRGGDVMPAARSLAAGALLLAALVIMSREAVQGIFTRGDDTAKQFAAYLDASIAPDERIATWEWEIAFLAREHDFSHPPTPLLRDLIAEKQLNAVAQRMPYSLGDADADYIVVGPFAKWTQLYDAEYLHRHCILVKSIGEYDLYKAVSSADTPSSR